MFHITIKADVTVNVSDPVAAAEIKTKLTTIEQKIDTLIDALVPGQAVNLGLRPGAVAEQP